MRVGILLIVLTLGLFPANTWAQTREPLPSWSIAHRAGSPAEGWPSDPLPQFSVPPLTGRAAVPLPQIGLPLPPIGLRPPKVEGRPTRSRRPGRFALWPYMVVVVPGYAPGVNPAAVSQTAPPIVATKGSLVLGVQPAAAQVFVDGYYVGAAEEFGGGRGGAFLEAGPHAIELIACGYEPVSFDVKIAPNESVVYRRELKSIETQAPAAPPAAKTPTTIYMIPGCYVGNIPPKDAGLPPTCDPARAQKFVM